MTRSERVEYALDYFLRNSPETATELHFGSPFQLLVAVVLSAQCTDKRVNLTTPALFSTFPTASAMSKGSISEIHSLIKSISYPNSKSRHLSALSKIIDEQYRGRVPMSMDELVKLPGVGRKTANVILNELEGRPTIAVDTHVFRVSARIGLTTGAKTPLSAEKQLLTYFPEKYIHKLSHWLIMHGRTVCKARKPLCESCGLKAVCKFYLKKTAGKKIGE